MPARVDTALNFPNGTNREYNGGRDHRWGGVEAVLFGEPAKETVDFHALYRSWMCAYLPPSRRITPPNDGKKGRTSRIRER
jgi:hypothetical protein